MVNEPSWDEHEMKPPLQKPVILYVAKRQGSYAITGAWVAVTLAAILLAIPYEAESFQELGAHIRQQEQQIAILGVTIEGGHEIGALAHLVVVFAERADASGLAVVFPRASGRLSPMAETSVQQAIYRAARVARLSTDSWSVRVSVLQSGLTIQIFLKKPGMIMDFGGMKGYTADRVASLFKKRGINNDIIAVAGDIWVLGHREDGKPWRIGVQHPREHDKTLAVLDLSDKYISTSGDYERFVIKENKRYHHIIDPRTGKPSKGTISATLIGDTGAIIDPLAKVPFILGPDDGMKIVKKLGAEAIIVDDQGKVYMTEGIKNLLDQPKR